MIAYLRGTSGSGKSYVGFQFVETYPTMPVVQTGWLKNDKLKQVAYRLPGDLYVVGRYNEGVPTGGVDGWKPHDKIIDLVETCAGAGHVFVELRSSFSIPHLQRWSKAFGLVVCYLDTPLDTCVENVYKRRAKGRGWRDAGSPLNVEAMRQQQNQLFNQIPRYEALGIKTKVIDHINAFNGVRALLWDAGWRP